MNLSAEDAVRAFFAAYNARDVVAVMELLADDFVYDDVGMGSKQEGKEQLAAYFEQALQIPDLNWEVHSIFSSGDRVAVESTYTGKLPAGLGPNTGDSPLLMTARAAQIIDTKNGLLVRFADYHHMQLEPLPED